MYIVAHYISGFPKIVVRKTQLLLIAQTQLLLDTWRFLTLSAQLLLETHYIFIILFVAKIIPLACDIRDSKAVKETVNRMQDLTGQLPSVVVNNAAGNFISPTERLSCMYDHILYRLYSISHTV